VAAVVSPASTYSSTLGDVEGGGWEEGQVSLHLPGLEQGDSMDGGEQGEEVQEG